MLRTALSPFFFFNDTATTEIYTLSLHDALPISPGRKAVVVGMGFIGSEVAASLRQSGVEVVVVDRNEAPLRDRKSTRLNSSHANISYAVFCLKKKTEKPHPRRDEGQPAQDVR